MRYIQSYMPARSIRNITAMLLLLFACAGAALAQTDTGQISGTVTDPQGALISGATVTVRSTGTGAERSATSGEDGNYIVTNLQPGLYEVTVNAGGFQPVTQQAQVTVGGRLTVDIQLGTIAGASETVNVIGGEGGVEINTSDQQLSDVVTGTQIRELPTLTRNPYDLVSLSSNVSDADPSGRGTGFAINGQRAASTNILLDGVENVDTFRAQIGQQVPLDGVQEFRVITSNFSAEYGRASGGVVNVATRAGSNDFNGTAYIFNRISRLASNGFDNNANGIPRGVFTRNQFGYSVGGPIVKNRLFFFNSTEFIRVRSRGEGTALVPAAEFLARSNARTQAFFNAYGNLQARSTGRVLTVGNLVNLFQVEGGNFAALPASTPAFQQVAFPINLNLGGGDPQNSYQTVARVDFNISDRTQLFGRYALESQDFFEGTNAFSPYAGFNTGSTFFKQNYLASLTHQFTPNLVSTTKLAYNRLSESQPLGGAGVTPTLYFFPFTGAQITAPQVDDFTALPGILPFSPGTGLPAGGAQNVGQVNHDFNYTIGKQNIRFGGQYIYIQDNRSFGAYQTASATLAPQGDFATALENFVNGQLYQFQAAVDPQGRFPGQTVTLPVGQPDFTRSNRYNEFALYANDSIRIHPRVTMNVGLRYEFYGVQKNKNPKLDSNFYFGPGANIFEQIRNGQVLLAPDSPLGRLYKNDVNNFAPRFGLAWDVFGDGKTSLRGGYGLAYERNFGNVTFNVIQNPPNYAVISITTDDPNFASIPLSVNNAGLLGGGTGTVVLPPTSLRNLNQNLTNAYAHFYSLAFEREIARNTIATVEYSGSAGRDLYTIENINRAGSGLLYLGSRATTPTGGTSTRLNGQYTNFNTRGQNGFSNYNALIATLDSSNFRSLGLNFTARYTYSVTKDNLSSTFSESANNFNLGLLDPFNPRLDYGYADFDVRHRFAGSFNYEVPFFNNIDNRVLRNILGGFSLTGIVTARTGSPFTVFDCTTAGNVCLRLVPTGSFETSGSGSPSVVGTNLYRYIDLSNQTPTVFRDVSGATNAGPFPANMTARNSFRSPGFYNIDMGLFKRFRLTENTSLQLRAEVFNILNHANLYATTGSADLSAFPAGQAYVGARRGITPGGAPVDRRNVQLAVKFIF